MKLILGTRGSPLALAQARMTASAIEVAHGWPAETVEIRIIKTTGDRIQDRPLADIGGKALWTKELDQALLAGETHASVHSMKDVESDRPDALCIAAMLRRADTRDRMIGAESIEALPQGARIGTSSPRRAAQLLALRPDLEIVPLRGNVDTRLAKVAAKECDATLLAAAGLDRLGRTGVGHAPAPLAQVGRAPLRGHHVDRCVAATGGGLGCRGQGVGDACPCRGGLRQRGHCRCQRVDHGLLAVGGVAALAHPVQSGRERPRHRLGGELPIGADAGGEAQEEGAE